MARNFDGTKIDRQYIFGPLQPTNRSAINRYMERGGEFADINMRNMLTCLFLFAPDGPRGDCHSGSVAACGEIRQLFLCGKFYWELKVVSYHRLFSFKYNRIVAHLTSMWNFGCGLSCFRDSASQHDALDPEWWARNSRRGSTKERQGSQEKGTGDFMVRNKK